ncbi:MULTISPECIES: cytochrome P450 [unclassified Streptomyces]|uniref:cytochrome P450 n=1 Tax=unclassified Streptomyces TaxID=2593676 RepID=UPI00225AC2A0|nr:MULTISPECIES: cytochrome P450 [unclassified Streptomyces]MCX4528652.1 cytochrome P450 [Streptomyces sp. NBC_01551]MCX4540741.1 cytochrome P450 [Streptomyces sp. NBC_01565]
MTVGSHAGAGREVPELAGVPLLGSLLDLKSDSLGTYLRAQQRHGDVVRITAGPPGLRAELYCVFSPEGAQQVLGSQAANFRKDNSFYQEVRESFGNGLLTSQDEDYLRQRRLVQPLFTKRRVDGYAGAVAAETELTLCAWREAEVVDVCDEMTHLALRAVTRILFGTDGDTAVDVVDRCFPVITEYVLRRGYSPANLPRTWPTPANKRAAAALDELYAVCDRIVAERLGSGGSSSSEDARGARAAAGDDLLSLLAGAKSADDAEFDAVELREQVLIFLLAGHETTATSLAFALHLLARHPEQQGRAREEVSRVLGDRTPEAADLDRLPYLTRVLKEAMRLYPAAPVIGRQAVAETRIDGHGVPAGADVIIAPWVTHRHPLHWPDPDRFDPDRFTPEAEAARPRYAWFPFGGGPRACIGQHFSMLESVIALAMILRAYEFEAVDADVPVSTGITLRANGPARCRLRSLAG